MKASEVRELSVEESKSKVTELTEELFNLRMQNTTGQLDNPSKIRYVKRDIARLKTIIAEKERQS